MQRKHLKGGGEKQRLLSRKKPLWYQSKQIILESVCSLKTFPHKFCFPKLSSESALGSGPTCEKKIGRQLGRPLMLLLLEVFGSVIAWKLLGFWVSGLNSISVDREQKWMASGLWKTLELCHPSSFYRDATAIGTLSLASIRSTKGE